MDDLGLKFQKEAMTYTIQCVDGPMARLPYTLTQGNDPSPIIFEVLRNYCDAGKSAVFESALEEYKQCSGTDLEPFYETVWSAMMGGYITCSEYIYNLGQKQEKCYYKDNYSECMFPLPRIPAECVNTFLGDNPVGNFLRNDLTYEIENLDCLAVLGHRMPGCTLRRWPVPIQGDFLKFGACFASKMKNIAVMACDEELGVLSECLPSSDELSSANKSNCEKWTKACTTDRLTNDLEPAVRMFLPPPLSAMPLNDICQSTDVSADLQDVVIRFEAFQDACESKVDMEFWRKPRPSTSVKQSEITAGEFSSIDSDIKDDKSSGLHLGLGFFSGMVIAAVGIFYIVRKKRSMSNPAAPPGGLIANQIRHDYRAPEFE